MAFKAPHKYGVRHPLFGYGDGNNGFFQMDGPCGRTLNVQSSDGGGWEHVSVSIKGMGRLPNWLEMCFVKDQFWEDEDCVIQYHPPRSDYVDNAAVLHMWRPIGIMLPRPPSIMVGLK